MAAQVYSALLYVAAAGQPSCFLVASQLCWRIKLPCRDFCCSSRFFNPPQHRVHKLAINLQRVGRKVLLANELPGRRCLNMLHPDGPRAAADEEAAEILVTKNDPQYSSQLLLAAADEQQGAAGAAGPSAGGVAAQTQQQVPTQQTLSVQRHAAAVAAVPQTAQAQHAVLAIPESISAALHLWDASYEQLGAGDWGLLFRELPDPQVDNVTQQLKLPVVYQPYSSLQPPQQQQQQDNQQQSTALQDGSQQQQQEQTEQQQQGAPAMVEQLQLQAPLRPTAGWLHAMRPVTWRCQWLYARVQELTSLVALLQQQGNTIPINSAAAAAASTPGAATAAAAVDALASSSSTGDAVDGLSLLQIQQHGILLPQHVAAVETYGSVLQSPFFAAHLSGTHADSLSPLLERRQPTQQQQPEQASKQQLLQGKQQQGQEDSGRQGDQQQQQQQQGQGDGAAAMQVDQSACDGAPAAADPQVQQQQQQQPPSQEQPGQQQQATTSGIQQPDNAAAVTTGGGDGSSSTPAAPGAAVVPAAAAVPGHAAAAPAAAVVGDHDSDAALVFSSLELVEHQLVAARLMIARAFGIEVSLAPPGVRLGQYTSARVWGDADSLNPAAAHGPGQKRNASTAGLGLARGLSGVLERGGGSGRYLQREGSLAGSMKKRRIERSGAAGIAGSIDVDDGVLSPSSSLPARLMERVVSLNVILVRCFLCFTLSMFVDAVS